MLSFFTSLLPTSFLPEWLSLEMNPLDCVLQGEPQTCLFPAASTWLPTISLWICLHDVSMSCRADWSMWDLCALLLDESPFFPRRAQVRDLSLVRFDFGDWFFWLGFTSRHTEKICNFSSCSQNISVFCMSHLTFPPAAAIKMKKTHWIRRYTVIKGQIQMDSAGWFSFSLWLWFWQ